MTQQRNDKVRTQGLVRPPALTQRSVPCVSWAVCALEIVEQAAKTFVQLHDPELRGEFGLVVHCTYKYETASQHRDPEQWVVPSDGRRLHCNVTFEIGFVGGMSVLTEVRYNHIQDKRPVPFPVQLRKTSSTLLSTPKLFSNGCTSRKLTTPHTSARSGIMT